MLHSFHKEEVSLYLSVMVLVRVLRYWLIMAVVTSLKLYTPYTKMHVASLEYSLYIAVYAALRIKPN